MRYGCVDDCRSQLGKRLMQWRAERPSEWLMDEFIMEAESQHEQMAQIMAEADHLLGVLIDIDSALKEEYRLGNIEYGIWMRGDHRHLTMSEYIKSAIDAAMTNKTTRKHKGEKV